jgi:hypothetical protein
MWDKIFLSKKDGYGYIDKNYVQETDQSKIRLRLPGTKWTYSWFYKVYVYENFANMIDLKQAMDATKLSYEIYELPIPSSPTNQNEILTEIYQTNVKIFPRLNLDDTNLSKYADILKEYNLIESYPPKSIRLIHLPKDSDQVQSVLEQYKLHPDFVMIRDTDTKEYVVIIKDIPDLGKTILKWDNVITDNNIIEKPINDVNNIIELMEIPTDATDIVSTDIVSTDIVSTESTNIITNIDSSKIKNSKNKKCKKSKCYCFVQ